MIHTSYEQIKNSENLTKLSSSYNGLYSDADDDNSTIWHLTITFDLPEGKT
ncbi:hypothetical protein [Maribacter sp.]|uniref:hypothetical protein n=1 Tax=Maribacter sp. TaxID=1897614 RepID=UPI00329903A2